MTLRDRKAYALLSLYLQAVRTVAPAAAPEDLEVVWESVYTLARDVGNEPVTEEPQPPLDTFLVEAVENVEEFVARRFRSNPTPEVARRVLDELKRGVTGFKCAKCANGPICNGLETDDAIVGAQDGGRCIEAIKTAIADACRTTDGEYEKHAGGLPLPNLVFRTTALEDPPGAIPVPGIAINGMTRYEDGEAGKVSEIDVRVAPAALSRLSVAGLPYLLLHEVFCHAYQMMVLEGPRPNRGAVPDPLSEGMTDAVAMKLLEQEVARRGAGSDFVHRGNMEAARTIHQARYSLDLEPRFLEAPWVRQGVAAAEAVEYFYARDTSPEQAAEDTIALTVSLNAAGWDFALRNKGLTNLLGGLSGPTKDPELMWLLLEFRVKRDIKGLVDYLTII